MNELSPERKAELTPQDPVHFQEKAKKYTIA